MVTVHAVLEGEDLQRWFAVQAKYTALELNPGAYSQNETEQIVGVYARFFLEVRERYPRLKGEGDWRISRVGEVYTGQED